MHLFSPPLIEPAMLRRTGFAAAVSSPHAADQLATSYLFPFELPLEEPDDELEDLPLVPLSFECCDVLLPLIPEEDERPDGS